MQAHRTPWPSEENDCDNSQSSCIVCVLFLCLFVAVLFVTDGVIFCLAERPHESYVVAEMIDLIMDPMLFVARCCCWQLRSSVMFDALPIFCFLKARTRVKLKPRHINIFLKSK